MRSTAPVVRHAPRTGLAYREAGPPDAPAVVCLHGWPQSSWMWEPTLRAMADRGLRGIAPDLAGFGRSPARTPATWAGHRQRLDELRTELGLERIGLAVHDWGGLIGLRWACDHPGVVDALSISDAGFFSDKKWHALAESLRTPGEGEALLDALDRHAFADALRAAATGMREEDIDEYFLAFSSEERRRGQLDLYRSGEFQELDVYEGRLAALGVPTFVLWGGEDPFAEVDLAHRYAASIPGARVEILPGVGHFIFDDARDVAATLVAEFFAEALLT